MRTPPESVFQCSGLQEEEKMNFLHRPFPVQADIFFLVFFGVSGCFLLLY